MADKVAPAATSGLDAAKLDADTKIADAVAAHDKFKELEAAAAVRVEEEKAKKAEADAKAADDAAAKKADEDAKAAEKRAKSPATLGDLDAVIARVAIIEDADLRHGIK